MIKRYLCGEKPSGNHHCHGNQTSEGADMLALPSDEFREALLWRSPRVQLGSFASSSLLVARHFLAQTVPAIHLQPLSGPVRQVRPDPFWPAECCLSWSSSKGNFGLPHYGVLLCRQGVPCVFVFYETSSHETTVDEENAWITQENNSHKWDLTFKHYGIYLANLLSFDPWDFAGQLAKPRSAPTRLGDPKKVWSSKMAVEKKKTTPGWL